MGPPPSNASRLQRDPSAVKAVTSIADVSKAVIGARTQGKRAILLRVKTAEATRFILMARFRSEPPGFKEDRFSAV